MQEKTYGVTGMTCAACAAHVQKAVQKTEGVLNGDVNLATEKLTVRFDEQKTGFNALQKAVEDAGYGLCELSDAASAELSITGMSCASCAAAIERAVIKLDGVESVSVNLATNRASVSYTRRVPPFPPSERPFPTPATARKSQQKRRRTLASSAAKRNSKICA